MDVPKVLGQLPNATAPAEYAPDPAGPLSRRMLFTDGVRPFVLYISQYDVFAARLVLIGSVFQAFAVNVPVEDEAMSDPGRPLLSL
jgi:hypothetical protein